MAALPCANNKLNTVDWVWIKTMAMNYDDIGANEQDVVDVGGF